MRGRIRLIQSGRRRISRFIVAMSRNINKPIVRVL